MGMNNLYKGSEWGKWDLHIHTPSTKLANEFNSNDKGEEFEELQKIP